ncbi:hypothetical protein J3E64_000608 [Sphingobium sp. OAS761]|uniref:phasin family protein n=1 Tax=Sphingobium sp. OAS761 TaxID=2817901 RepID=UPI00209D860B|nr:phasin family protein [Sphingobium sp. OAS761]MCP1468937.1 hypothetical protein [Sphingobium sp. OAS761]
MAQASKPRRPASPAKGRATALSASEALKAAEAAIGADTLPKKRAPRKVAASAAKPTVSTPAQVQAAVKPIDTNPQSAPPAPAPDPAPAPTPPPPAEETPTKDVLVEPETTKSLNQEAVTEIQTLLPATEGTQMMNDMIETGKKFAEDAKAKLETVYADLNEKAKAGVEKSTKAVEELSDLAKGNVEAFVESGKIAAKGMETMGQEAVDFTRKNFEKATASFKSFSTVKTPTEFFQLQSQLMSSSFDDFAKEAAKSSEAMMKLAGDVAQPLTARVTIVTDKIKAIAA